MLRHVSQWCLRPETLKAANRTLVDFHHRMPISTVWGTGIRSSSDGQRFAVQQDSKIVLTTLAISATTEMPSRSTLT